ncbi:hypothetical protein ACPA9J_10350 [Pseudomonas aeruginosa]
MVIAILRQCVICTCRTSAEPQSLDAAIYSLVLTLRGATVYLRSVFPSIIPE